MQQEKCLTKRVFLICLSLVCATVLFAPCRASSDTAADKKDIQTLCNKAAKCFTDKNLDKFSEIVEPSVIFDTGDGTQSINFDEWKTELTKFLETMDSLKSTCKIEKCVIKDNTAVVNVVETDNYLIVKDKGHKFRNIEKLRLMLIKTDKGWLTKRVSSLSTKMLRDGKPYKPKM